MTTPGLQILHRKKNSLVQPNRVLHSTTVNDSSAQLLRCSNRTLTRAECTSAHTAVGNSSSRTCQQPSHTPPASSAVSDPQTWEVRGAGACLRASSVLCTKHDELEPQAESSHRAGRPLRSPAASPTHRVCHHRPDLLAQRTLRKAHTSGTSSAMRSRSSRRDTCFLGSPCCPFADTTSQAAGVHCHQSEQPHSALVIRKFWDAWPPSSHARSSCGGPEPHTPSCTSPLQKRAFG